MKYFYLFISILFVTNTQARPLYLVSGGFVSCDFSNPLSTFHYGSTKKASLLGTFKKVFNPRSEEAYIFTCFGLNGTSSHKRFVKAKMRITDSENPSKDSLIRVRDYVPYVKNFFHQNKDRLGLDSIVLIGHSHGSYLHMKSLLDLGLDLPVESMTSLDPISKIKCGMWDFVRAFFFFRLSKHCKKFPTDIDEGKRERIISKVGKWLNIYETKFKLLHSGPVNVSGVEDHHFPDETHASLNNSPEVWKLIKGF